MENYPYEVLIYIDKVKKFFEINVEARKFFLIDKYYDEFFAILAEVSNQNFIERNEPTLSPEQLSTIRYNLINKNKLFINLGNFGNFYLN